MIPTAIRQRHVDKLSFTRAALLVDVLFTEEGFDLKPVKFTTTNKTPSTDAEQLDNFSDHEFVEKLIEFKKLGKMTSTYIGKPYDEKKKGPTEY